MIFFKTLWSYADAITFGIWGIGVIDALFMNLEFLSGIDEFTKSTMAVAGAVYFLMQIPHKLRMQKKEFQIKNEEFIKLQRENNQLTKNDKKCI